MKVEKVPFKLKSCVWEITLACCFSCKYCGSKGGRAREHELTTVECLDVVKQLSDLGCRRASLIGGEVFMRPDWATIVRELTESNIRVSIITNGYLFSEKVIEQLKEINIESVAVSLDGPESIHDEFRQKGSFNRANKAIDVLTKNGIPVSVISTLHSQNVYYLETLYEYLKSKSISAWQLQACSPMGNAVQSGIDYRFDFNIAIDFVEKHLQKSPFMIGIADNIGYFTSGEGCLRGNTSGKGIFRGCRAGLTSVGIDSVGNVRGCESMYDDSFVEGNLREKSLSEIWNNPDAFAYNRQFKSSQLTGKCSSCRHGDICAGGCRSYNYFTHGKLYEAKNCAYKNNKELAKTVHVGDVITFGRYPQTKSNEVKDIEWLVLNIKNGQALLISKDCLITSPYCDMSKVQENHASLGWDRSRARTILNENFFFSAFNEEERKRILPHSTSWSRFHECVRDQVFLLREDEVVSYLPTLESRKAYPTELCINEGARIDMDSKGVTCWWLLPYVNEISDSLGKRQIYPKAVFQTGEIQYHGRNIYHSDFTLRPAILISLD